MDLSLIIFMEYLIITICFLSLLIYNRYSSNDDINDIFFNLIETEPSGWKRKVLLIIYVIPFLVMLLTFTIFSFANNIYINYFNCKRRK